MGRRGLAFELSAYLLAAASLAFGVVHERLSPAPFRPAARSDELLRVVTWNVGSALESGDGGLADEHLELVARVLNDLDPDVCFLQELAGRFQLRRLQRALGEGWVAVVSPERSTRRVAALARRGALEPFDASAAGPRALGVVYRREDRPPVALVGLHADAFSAAKRNAEIGAATDLLLANGAARAHVLAGDLNLDLDIDKRRDLFTDDEYLDVETYNYVARGLVDLARGRGSTAEPDRRLDYLFADPALELRGAGPLAGRRLGGMDHDPLAADLVLPR